MIPAIKAEFRKLVTVRSTYVILAACLAIEMLFAFYATGYKADAAALRDPLMLAGEVTTAVSALSVIIALIGVLLVTHEYRYNTILYTLTSAKRRSYVFLAKFLVIGVLAVVLSLLFGALSPVLVTLGVQLSGHSMVPQVIPYGDILWRIVFAGWCFSIFGFILAVIIRAQLGAAISIFLIPTTLEPLLGLVLKSNHIYLPFAALSNVLEKGKLSYTHAAAVASIYVGVGLIISWVLFVRRDVNN
ncbi:MAG: hypothetical protein JWO35_211 [Candidatus Saccharibacteria bacterium]|nr:hypothetical protein [Candidatus Saccharibacteria bacterium]